MFKRKDGLWQDSLTIDGRRVTFAGKTQNAVKQKMRNAEIKRERSRTFAAVADDFTEDRFDDLTRGTMRTYSAALRSAVGYFGAYDMGEITPKMVGQYLATLKNRYAAKTIAKYKGLLSIIFNYAINEKGLDIVNPCQNVPLPKSNIKPRTRAALSPAVRAEIDKTRPDEFILAFLIVNTGARLGEACALQWSDVDFEQNIINITKSAHWNGNRPYIGQLKTKNAARIVPLLSPLRDMLEQIKGHKKADYIVSGAELLTMSQLEARWLKFCQDHGLAHSIDKTWNTKGTARRHLDWVCDIDRHTLRHDYATSLFRAGVPVKTVQHLLGHADYQTTMDIYVHFQRANVDDAREQIEDYLRNKKSAGR